MQIAWALGAMLETVLAIIILIPFGWRWWLMASALPLLLFAVMCAVSMYLQFLISISQSHYLDQVQM